jgi:hypothetical protein
MTGTWPLIAVLFVGTVAFKAAGPLALGHRRPPEPALRVIALVAPALLTGLVIYETFVADSSGLTVDARLVGLAVAAGAAAARLPMMVVIVLAAGATAALRALT